MATNNKLDKIGLSQVWSKITTLFVAKEVGKGLSTNDYSTDEKTKLQGIAENANVNVLEKVKVNGAELTITEKAVDITIPTGALASLDKVALAQLTDELQNLINGKATKATTLDGYGITDAYTQDQVDTKINEIKTDIAGAYIVQGSIEFANLPVSTEESPIKIGSVYNVTDAFTADTTFKTEDQGKEYPAGTNVVYTSDGWDCLAGTYDFSVFLKKTDIVDITEAEINEICVLPNA